MIFILIIRYLDIKNMMNLHYGRIVYILGPIGVEQSQFTHKKLASFHKQTSKLFTSLKSRIFNCSLYFDPPSSPSNI